MYKANILNLVARNLTYIDLAIFSQVSKITNSVCSRDELWENECIRLFAGNLDVFAVQNFPTSAKIPGKSSANWKELTRCIEMAKKAWLKLEGDVFTMEDLKLLQETMLTNLLDPSILPPVLRRENYYPTVVQDLIANELFPSDGLCLPSLPTPDEDLLLKLDDVAQYLFEQFAEQKEINHLTLARWMCRDSRKVPSYSGSSLNMSDCLAMSSSSSL